MRIRAHAGTNLQLLHDSMPSGGVIELEQGTYTGDLTITNAGINIIGIGPNTLIDGSVLVSAERTRLSRMFIRHAGNPYGLKLHVDGGEVKRCWFDDLVIGATSRGAGNGPVTGIIIDGAILSEFHQVTVGFCTDHGILVDSTDAANPNTTLHFYGCSVVGCDKFGVNMQASCNIANFYGGNIEQNGHDVAGGHPENFAEVNLDSMNHACFFYVDFESDTVGMGNVVKGSAGGPYLFDGCNFLLSAGGSVTTPLGFATCTGVGIIRNKFAGFVANSRIGQCDENSYRCYEWGNRFENVGDRIMIFNP